MSRANKKGYVHAKRLHWPRLTLPRKKFPTYATLLFICAVAAFVLFTSPTKADIETGLVGKWKLDEGTGTTTADISGNGNDGTLVRDTGTSPAWVTPGHDGTGAALEFDGAGAQGAAGNTVNIGNSAVLDELDNYTISVWAKFEPQYVGNGGTWANLVGRTSPSTDWAWMIYVNNQGRIRPHHKNSNGTFAPLTNSQTVLPTGDWVHIEQVADNGNLYLYIDGQLDPNFPISYTGTYSLPTGNVYIGQDTREYTPLATISEVSIYNKGRTAPGGVTGDLQLWMRGDSGVTGTSPVSSWADFSGNGNTGTATGDPGLSSGTVNFNDTISFDGTSDGFDTNLDIDPARYPDLAVFSVYRPTADPAGAVWGSDDGSWDRLYGQLSSCTGTSDGTGCVTVPDSFSTNEWKLSSVVFDEDAANGSSAYVNGAPGTTFTSDHGPEANANFKIGQVGDDSSYLNGDIAEVIVYNQLLDSDNGRQRVESYLAARYGITLGDTGAPIDYLASDGTAFWTGSATYQNDVAGIGRDDTSPLDQRQSKSENSGAFVTMGNGAIAVDNDSNPNSFADNLSFMMWGNDDASTDVANDVVQVGGTGLKRMERIWSIQETGTVGTAKLQIPQAELSGTSPTLLVSNDETFDNTDTQIALTTNGANYEADVNFTDGQFFTFGVEMTEPGVTTDQANNITDDAATLHGTLDSLGDFTQADVLFRYRIAGSVDPYTETTPQPLNAAGPFSANISGLDHATEYEFKAVVQWQAGGTQEMEGSLLEFETAPVPPDAPTTLQATAAGTSQINLSWNAPADEGGSPITGYKIERSLDGTSGWTTVVADTGNTDTTYQDTGLDSNTEYFYRVSAINSAGAGAASNIASATTDELAPQVTTDPATAVAQTSATLDGTLNIGDFTPVNVFFRYRVEGSGNPFTETAARQPTSSGAFSTDIVSLDPSTTYEYKAVVQWEDGGTQEAEGSLVTFTTFADDGTPACVEDNVDCFVNPVTGTNVKLVVDDACTINTAEMKPETDMNVADPDGFEYPLGLMDFNLDCGTPGYTTTVTQYYYDVTDDNYILRKYNPNTEAYFTIDGVTITQTTLGNQTVTTATYQITDGGELDIDGNANGTIVDPAGLAVNPNNSDLAKTGQSIWIPASIATLIATVSLAITRKRKAHSLRP